MVELARLPWPRAFLRAFIPISLRIGPLTITTGPENHRVHSRPWMLNRSVQAASTAASTTGRYSGLQPAITALIATCSTVTGTSAGGTTATTSCGSRLVPSSIRRTRASVGGTTGRPSVQPRSNMASASSSSVASSIRRPWRRLPPKRTARASVRLGSTDSEPQPGEKSVVVAASPVWPVNDSQVARCQPSIRSSTAPPATRSTVGTVSIPWCQLTASSVSSTGDTPAGNAGSSWV